MAGNMQFQVQLTAPSLSNMTGVQRAIQNQLKNVSVNIQLKNGAKANQALNQITSSTNKATKATQTFADAVGLSGRRFIAYTSAVAVVGRLTAAIARGTRDAIKFEREFVKLAQVFDTNVGNLKGLNKELSKLSIEYAISANVIAKTSVVLAQSGLTARQTAKAMAAIAKADLAPTFGNIASTAEGAVAIMAQFRRGAGKLADQLGAVNAVAKKFAVESQDIIEAVRRAGGAFEAAGGNFNEFIALFTAVRSTTRESAETIATGFRTIFARVQRPRTIEYFKKLNIELVDLNGNFVGPYEAIRRLSEGLDRLGIKAGQIKFAEVVEQLGGIRQVSRVIPLLGQFTKAEKARQVALTGGKSIDEDAAKAKKTLAYQIDQVRQEFAALIREISETSTFRNMVQIGLDMAKAFIEVARAIKPLIPLIATFGAIKLSGLAAGAIKKGFNPGTALQINKGGKVPGFSRGGPVPGAGDRDTVPAMLEPGEFVIRKSAVQAFGADRLAGINKYSGGTGKKGVPKPKKSNVGQSAKDLSKTLPRVGNHYDIGPIHDNPSVKINRKYGKNDSGGGSYTNFRNQAYDKFKEAIKVNDEKGGGGKGFINALNRLTYLTKNVTEYRDSESKASIFGKKYKNYKDFKKGFLKSDSSQGQYLNKTTGALAEIWTEKNKLKGAQKLGTAFGADFQLKDPKKFAEVKTLRQSKEDVDGDNKLKAKAVLAYGLRKTKDKKTLKNKKPNSPRLSLDYYNFYKKFAKGGAVGTDTVPALLTPGEFVVNKKSAETFGYGKLRKINKYAKGGVVQKFAEGGEVGDAGGIDLVGVATQFGFMVFTLKQTNDAIKNFKEKVQNGGQSLEKRQKLSDKLLQIEKELAQKKQASASRVADTEKVRDHVKSNVRKETLNVVSEARSTAIQQTKGYFSHRGDINPVYSEPDKTAKAQTDRQARLKIADIQEKMGKGGVKGLKQINLDKVNKDVMKVTGGKFKEGSKGFAMAREGYIKSLEKNTDRLIKSDVKMNEWNNNVDKAKAANKKLIASTERRSKQLDKISASQKGVRGLATRGVRGAKKAVSNIDPLVVTAGIFTALNTVLGATVDSFATLKNSAIENGDAVEAGNVAVQESRAKSTKELVLGFAAAGAAIGTVVPVVGTAVGALSGALVGAAVSSADMVKDFGVGVLNSLAIFGKWKTTAEKEAEAKKKATEAARSVDIGKALNEVSSDFNNLSRDIDPKKNFGGYAAEANKLAIATEAQRVAVKAQSKDAPGRAEQLAKINKLNIESWKKAAEAGAAQGKSYQEVADSAPQLFKAFEKSLDPKERESVMRAEEKAHTARSTAVNNQILQIKRQIELYKKQNALMNDLNATVSVLALSAQRSAEALSNVKAASDLTATTTVGTSGAEQLGDISNIVDPQKFNQALNKAVSLGFDSEAARGVSLAANTSNRIKQSGITSKSEGDISSFVGGVTDDPRVKKTIDEELKKLFAEGQVHPQAVQQLLEKHLVKPSQEAANKMAEGLKANAEKLNNFAAALDIFADSIRKVRDSQREQLESQIEFSKTLRGIRGEKTTTRTVLRDSALRQKQTLGAGGTTFNGRNLINNSKATADAIIVLRNRIESAGKEIRSNLSTGTDSTKLIDQQKVRQERLKDLNKALKEQIDTFKEYKDVILEEIQVEKQRADQIKAEAESKSKASLQDFVKQAMSRVDAQMLLASKDDPSGARQLSQEGSYTDMRSVQSGRMSKEVFEQRESRRKAAYDEIAKRAKGGDKEAEEFKKGIDALNTQLQDQLVVRGIAQSTGLSGYRKGRKPTQKQKEGRALQSGVIDESKETVSTIMTGSTSREKRLQNKLIDTQNREMGARKQQEEVARDSSDRVRRNLPTGGGAINQTNRIMERDMQSLAISEQNKNNRKLMSHNTKSRRQNSGNVVRAIEQQPAIRISNNTIIKKLDDIKRSLFLKLPRFSQDHALHLITVAGFDSIHDGVSEIIALLRQEFIGPQAPGVGMPGSLADMLPGVRDAFRDGALGGVQLWAKGGPVYADKGTLVNYEPKGTDTIPAMLTPGEFVVKKQSVDRYGTQMMRSINSGSFSGGGKVNYLQGGGRPAFMPGLVTKTTKILSESITNFGSFLSGGSLDNFALSVETMLGGRGFALFSTAVDRFSEIPKEFTMELAPTQVTVSLNGAEILAQMIPMVQNEVYSAISSEIEQLKTELRSGDVA